MDVLKAMQADAGILVPELRVDGGATVNNLLMQFQADILGIDVVRPKITETTALGAAYLAGLAVGYWNDIDDVQGQWQLDTRFSQQLAQNEVSRHVAGWQRAVTAANQLGQCQPDLSTALSRVSSPFNTRTAQTVVRWASATGAGFFQDLHHASFNC